MVADCLEGELFPPDEDFTYEEIREKSARTFISNIMTLNTTAYGAADLARKDVTLAHKKVKFPSPDDEVAAAMPGVDPFGMCRMKTALDKVDSEHSGCETSSEETTSSQVGQVETPTPNIVEKFMVCQCKRHEHCLTCRMRPNAFHLVVREAYKDISPSPSTRWVLALRSLDRSFQIWVGEHVKYLTHPTAGNQEWQTASDSLASEELTCIRDMINISYGISILRGKRARYFCQAIRKAVKLSNRFNDSIAQIALAGSDEAADKLKTKCNEYKKGIKSRLRSALDLLDKLEQGLLLFLHVRLRTVRDNMLKNFDLSNSTWPAAAMQKLNFMNEVLIGVYRDSMGLVPQLHEIYEVWKQPVKDDAIFEWSETVQGHIKFFGEWLDETEKGNKALLAWAEVEDRGKENCLEMHRYLTPRV